MTTFLKTIRVACVALVAFNLQFAASNAQNTVITYQGRVQTGGANFTGAGQFKFALVTAVDLSTTATASATISGQFVTIINVTDGGSGYVSPPAVTISGGGGSGATATASISAGVVTDVTVNNAGSGYTSVPIVIIAPPPEAVSYTTYWSNDGTSHAGSEPLAAVPVTVTDGLFSVALGNPAVPNMTAFPIGLFAQPDLRLRLWFNDGVNGFAVLNPAQRLTAAPYAMSAATAISAVSAASVSGPVNASQLTGAISSNAISPGSITADMLANHSVSADKLMTTPEWLLSRPILNPTPAMSEFFGHSVAGLGNDRIITGAYGDNIGTSGAGAAYLFSTSGALLTTFTNPTPMMGDEFGFVVAAMGSDRVLIGAHLDDFPVVDSGMAYLFSTNGTLLTTFTNPTCGRGSLWE